TVNKTGTGYYQLECKAVPDNSLTYRLTGINKQVALSPNPKVPFMWRKSVLDDGYFYLDCNGLPENERRLSARSTLGAYFTSTGLEGENSDVRWKLVPTDEPEWWMIEHKASGKFLYCDMDKIGLTDDKSLRSAVKWKMNLIKLNLDELQSPILLQGDDKTAFRDPILLYKDGIFRLYYSLALTEEDEKIYWYIAESRSEDLVNWSSPRTLTVKDQSKNFTDPGSIIKFNNQWIFSLQTYVMPGYTRKDPIRYGNDNTRNYIMRSTDLENWSEPEVLYVKGTGVDPGKMINGFILEDKDEKGKWWCFFKQNQGAGCSYSHDLKNWTYFGNTENHEYFMMHSPKDGLGILRSKDLKDWELFSKPTLLGKKDWPWASQRLTAGYVLDLRSDPKIGKYLMVFHGQGDGRGPARNTEVINSRCNIAIVWSDDLINWHWPGKEESTHHNN
ncbi:MAG: hypothetical protein NT144_13980, partial [Bacteroidia bacterium]|nr:hypothetical protein [Bacteroidia bacterium]